jgi:hypothetical protein
MRKKCLCRGSSYEKICPLRRTMLSCPRFKNSEEICRVCSGSDSPAKMPRLCSTPQNTGSAPANAWPRPRKETVRLWRSHLSSLFGRYVPG